MGYMNNEEHQETAAELILGPIQAAIMGIGITPAYLAKKLKAELEATEVKVFNGQEGLTYSDPLVAWKIRQEARKDAHKLLDQYPSEKHEVTHEMGNSMALAVQVFQERKKESP